MTDKPKKPSVDWEAVERLYRAGQVSVREIARQHEITEGAIRKEAKKRKWVRQLADKVRDAVREKIVRIDGTQNGTQPQRASDETVIETASEIGVAVRLTHRRDLQQLRAIGAILASRLAAHLNGDPSEGPFMGERESPGDLFEKLARVKSRLIPLERQAFNLDEDAPGGDDIVIATSDGRRKAALALLLAKADAHGA